jgi:hypothetical protein
MLPFGLLCSFPFLIVANKVRYSGFEDLLVHQGKINQNTFKNSLKAIKSLMKHEGGIRSFF